jgi:preprotein translocase subunit SecD
VCGRVFCWAIVAILLLTTGASAQRLEIAIERAELAYDQRTGEPLISFKMTESSARQFAELTRNNIGKPMSIRVDGRELTRPVIREPIVGGTGQVGGSLTVQQAKDIADRMSKGTAKVEFEIVPP